MANRKPNSSRFRRKDNRVLVSMIPAATWYIVEGLESMPDVGFCRVKKTRWNSLVLRFFTVHEDGFSNNEGEVKLHKVCRGNRVEELKEILNSGMEIDVNAACNEGWTPLHEAVSHGHVECVKELLNYRAPRGCENVNLRARSNDGTTPLIDAVENERVEVCRLLIAHGGQELLLDKKGGKSPIEIAHNVCPKNEAILQILESAHNQSNIFSHLSTSEVKKIVAILPVMISSYIEFRHTSGIEFKISYESCSPTHSTYELVNVDLLAVKKDLVEFRELRHSIVNLYKNNVNCMFLRNVCALFLSSNRARM